MINYFFIADFATVQSSDISFTREGNTKITTKISDKPDFDFMFPGLGGFFGNFNDDDEDEEFQKFIESFNFNPNDAAMQQLFSNQMFFPFPIGFAFIDPELNVNDNGVIDVSGEVGFNKEEAAKVIK